MVEIVMTKWSTVQDEQSPHYAEYQEVQLLTHQQKKPLICLSAALYRGGSVGSWTE